VDLASPTKYRPELVQEGRRSREDPVLVAGVGLVPESSDMPGFRTGSCFSDPLLVVGDLSRHSAPLSEARRDAGDLHRQPHQ
jgi:hypothetical protein